MFESLQRRAWWRERPALYCTPENHLMQLDRFEVELQLRHSAALQWRAWSQQHAPDLCNQVGLGDVERVEDGYCVTFSVAERAYWRFPGLTPRTYLTEGWRVLDGECHLARSLARRWARLSPHSSAQARLVLRALAEIEEVLGDHLCEFPVRRWFLVKDDHLDEDALTTFCAALVAFKEQVGQFPSSSVLGTLWSSARPTRIIQILTALLEPLHTDTRAVPDVLASWYIRQLIVSRFEEPDEPRLEEMRVCLQHITGLLLTFQQMAWGQLPVGLEAEIQRAVAPRNLELYLHRLVTENLPIFLQASGGRRLPLSVLEVLPRLLNAEVVRALAAVFSWAAWKQLLEQFRQDDLSFSLERPPEWATIGACALLITFGRRSHDWLVACQQKRGWSCHDSSHWLPLTPAPGLSVWLMTHIETSQDRLAWVAQQWNTPGFPRHATLAQMRSWQLENALSKAVPGLTVTLVEQLKPLMEYEFESFELCEAVQEVLPALLGEIPIDPRLEGRWELEEGRVLRFLAKTDPLGLVLGKATNCCQGWGGAGQACMVAGYRRPDSTFLVLEQGTRILAQSWVWIGKGGGEEALVLDNIEIPCCGTLPGNDVLALEQSWAKEYSEEHRIGVKLGTGSADYQVSCLMNASPSNLEGYDGYSDAERQKWLALPPVLAQLPAGVRPATWQDTDTLNALERQIYPEGLQTGVEVPSGNDGFVLLYEEARQPMGYLLVQLGYNWLETTEGYVYDLAVLPAARRRAVWPLAEALHRFATYYGLTHLGAHLREHTSYRLIKRHGERLGFVIEREDGWEERACDERFMKARIRIVPRAE